MAAGFGEGAGGGGGAAAEGAAGGGGTTLQGAAARGRAAAGGGSWRDEEEEAAWRQREHSSFIKAYLALSWLSVGRTTRKIRRSGSRGSRREINSLRVLGLGCLLYSFWLTQAWLELHRIHQNGAGIALMAWIHQNGAGIALMIASVTTAWNCGVLMMASVVTAVDVMIATETEHPDSAAQRTHDRMRTQREDRMKMCAIHNTRKQGECGENGEWRTVQPRSAMRSCPEMIGGRVRCVCYELYRTLIY
eukprot:1028161-Prymnesium_polylepis.1